MYWMKLEHLAPENKEAIDNQKDTGANLEGVSTGQTWDNLDIKKNDCNRLKQIQYIKTYIALEVAWALAHSCKISKGKESTWSYLSYILGKPNNWRKVSL